MFRWLLCALLFCSALQGAPEDSRTKRIVFLSPGRSGTNWMFYILQHFSQRKLYHANESYGCHREHNPFNFITTTTRPPIIHAHEAWRLQDPLLCAPMPVANSKEDHLIVIVRNPLESAIRQLMHCIGYSFQEMIAHYRDKEHELLFVNLALFDIWPSPKKLLVYYEDLLTQPEKIIPQIVKYIGEPTWKIEEFLDNIEMHKELCLRYYRWRHGSWTEGKDLTYHSKSLSPEEIQILYRHIKETNPKLWNKYLSRYDKLYQN